MVGEHRNVIHGGTIQQTPPSFTRIFCLKIKGRTPRGISRCSACNTACDMCSNWLCVDEISTARCPGVCPRAGITEMPGTISFSPSTNSIDFLSGARFFCAQLTRGVAACENPLLCCLSRHPRSKSPTPFLTSHIERSGKRFASVVKRPANVIGVAMSNEHVSHIFGTDAFCLRSLR
jgi:hypothetical protein